MQHLSQKVFCLASAALFSTFAFAAQRETARQSNTPRNDESFIRYAAEASMSQVDLGKLAEQKSQSPDVKKFASMMVEDHSKLTQQLKQIGMSERINLPTSVSRSDADSHRQLSASAGPAFDRSYVDRVTSDLDREISEFKSASTTATRPAIKDFAKRTLPTLESQLQEAKQLANRTSRERRP